MLGTGTGRKTQEEKMRHILEIGQNSGQLVGKSKVLGKVSIKQLRLYSLDNGDHHGGSLGRGTFRSDVAAAVIRGWDGEEDG